MAIVFYGLSIAPKVASYCTVRLLESVALVRKGLKDVEGWPRKTERNPSFPGLVEAYIYSFIYKRAGCIQSYTARNRGLYRPLLLLLLPFIWFPSSSSTRAATTLLILSSILL